ncbi:MAG: alpha/beta hydrolase [Micrococcaceae bacterium]
MIPKIKKSNLFALKALFAYGDKKKLSGLIPPSDIAEERGISFGPHGKDNLLDIYYPRDTKEPLPTIVDIHGGGWFYGGIEAYRLYCMRLATMGFAVVNFNYRLAPKNQYPAPLEDVNSVMNWVAEKGKEHFIDAGNLFFVGDSAGGQLAEQYITIMTNPDYAKLFEFKAPNLDIKAAGLNCGVYHIGKDKPVNEDFGYYFGEEPSEETKKQFPVEDYITSDFPPSFITTATDDFCNEFAKPLADILENVGVTNKFKEYRSFDGKKLQHVFHLGLKTREAEVCNQEQTDFFKKFINT